MNKLLNIAIVLVVFSVLYSFKTNEGKLLKPEKYPQSTIQMLNEYFNSDNVLDTSILLNYNYVEIATKFAKVKADSTREFVTIENKEIYSLLDYIKCKNILVLLDEYESQNNTEIKENLLFKIKIELKNAPVSIVDLSFTYNHWDLPNLEMENY